MKLCRERFHRELGGWQGLLKLVGHLELVETEEEADQKEEANLVEREEADQEEAKKEDIQPKV